MVIELHFRHAHQLSVGDKVLVERNDELTSVNVINVSSITMQGN